MSPLQELQYLHTQIQSRIIGQNVLVNRLLVALLADGHLLVEGAPGLAKTRAIKSLGARVYDQQCDFPSNWRSTCNE